MSERRSTSTFYRRFTPTSRDRVEPEEIQHVTNRGNNRQDIFFGDAGKALFLLPKTSLKDYRVRLFSFTFAALLYNLWRLTDFPVKAGLGRDIRPPPVVTARTFIRAVGRYLREID